VTSARIFVVEDEALIALELEDRLVRFGYEVVGLATSGRDVVDRILRAAPDLVLLDVHLGQGPTGLDVAEALRAVSQVPIVFLTAYADAAIVERAVAAHAAGYVVKPIRPEVVRANVEMALAMARSRADTARSEVRFRTLFDRAGVGAAEVDVASGRILRANRRLCALVSETEEAVCAQTLGQLAHPEDAAHVEAALATLHRGHAREVSLDVRVVDRRGEPTWVQVSVAALWTPGERSSLAVVVLSDISEQKRQEHTLREHSLLLDHAERIASLGGWSCDPIADVWRWTDEFRRVIGAPGDEPPSLFGLRSRVAESDRGRLDAWLGALRAGDAPAVLALELSEGRRRIVLAAERAASSGGHGPIVGTLQDAASHVRAEQALAQAHADIDATVAAVPDLLFELDATERFVACTSVDADLRVTAAAWRGRTLMEALSPGAAEAARMAMAQAASADGRAIRTTLRWERSDGVEWWDISLARKRSVGGRSNYVGLARNVTDDKAVDDALTALSTHLVRLRGADYFAAVAGEVCGLLGACAAFVAELPADALATVGLVVDGRVLPSARFARAGSPCDRTLASRDVTLLVGDIGRFDGAPPLEAIDASAYAGVTLVDDDGAPIGTIVALWSDRPPPRFDRVQTLLRLFAARTQAELARVHVEQQMEDLFEATPDAIFAVDADGRIVRANRVAETLFGTPQRELVGERLEVLVPGLVDTLASSGEPLGAQPRAALARRRDGTTLHVDVALGRMRRGAGGLLVATLRDVSERVRAETERRALEAQLRQSQKMEAIGRLAGGIAHDFNNLLAAMMTHTEVALASLPPDRIEAASLQEIGRAAERARDLVRKILAFSRNQTPERRRISIVRIVEEVAALLRSTMPVSITVAVALPERPVPPVSADASQLHQVLLNLGTNACQAIDRVAGRVTFGIDVLAPEDACGVGPLRGLAPGPYVSVTVRDDGRGMDEPTRERIFEPFFTTKPVGHGTGLGLAIAHGIVTEHGGALDVQSRVGAGTAMILYLPAVSGPESELPAAPREAAPVRGRIAYLDDEPIIVAGTTKLLTVLGYESVGFVDADQALRAVADDPQRFDCVITDFSMPRMSGVEVARRLHAIRDGLPVVLVSGFHPEGAAHAGVTVCIDKPFSPAELRSAVEIALGRAANRAPAE
jgi:PAS domain S-box-containing protein